MPLRAYIYTYGSHGLLRTCHPERFAAPRCARCLGCCCQSVPVHDKWLPARHMHEVRAFLTPAVLQGCIRFGLHWFSALGCAHGPLATAARKSALHTRDAQWSAEKLGARVDQTAAYAAQQQARKAAIKDAAADVATLLAARHADNDPASSGCEAPAEPHAESEVGASSEALSHGREQTGLLYPAGCGLCGPVKHIVCAHDTALFQTRHAHSALFWGACCDSAQHLIACMGLSDHAQRANVCQQDVRSSHPCRSVAAGTPSPAPQADAQMCAAADSDATAPCDADEDAPIAEPAAVCLPPPAFGDRSNREFFLQSEVKNSLLFNCQATGREIFGVAEGFVFVAPGQEPPARGCFCARQLGLEDHRAEDLRSAQVCAPRGCVHRGGVYTTTPRAACCALRRLCMSALHTSSRRRVPSLLHAGKAQLCIADAGLLDVESQHHRFDSSTLNLLA